MSSVPLAIEADVAGLDPEAPDRVRVVHGQAAVATTPGRVLAVRLTPPDPPASPEAVEAVRAADWVVLGPGSWYTSVAPHLLVPGLREALVSTRARRCVVLNLSAAAGETAGLTEPDHIRALTTHAPQLRLDVAAAVAEAGGRLVLRQVGLGDGSARHDPLRLAAAFRDVFDGALGDVGRRTPSG
jgi:uncharacterized cofD-like protein